jgi:hypothetical protein
MMDWVKNMTRGGFQGHRMSASVIAQAKIALSMFTAMGA